MHYIDSITGATYPLDLPRWRGDSGGHVNLADAPGLVRGRIDTSIRSLWRYRDALLVDAAHAVSMGEGWTPLVPGEGVRSHVPLLHDEGERIAEALAAEGYFGPFGVDAFTFIGADGANSLQPRSEINARYSMGFVVGMGARALHLSPEPR